MTHHYWIKLLFLIHSVKISYLAGLLTPDDCGWRQQVITLISSGIIERQNRPLAFDVIQQWAETLLSMQQEEQSDEAQRFVTLFKILW